MTEKSKVIGVHDGKFHDDEVVASAILTTIFKDYKIVRTRDPVVFKYCDFLVDVGEEYNHEKGRYDHHMPNPPTNENGGCYSSAGLVWKHWADRYLESINLPKSITIGDCLEFDIHQAVKEFITNRWIIPIDKVDNGELNGPTIISEVVYSSRPLHVQMTKDNLNNQFIYAMELVRKILERSCFHAAEQVILEAQEQYAEREYHFNDQLVVCDQRVRLLNKFVDTPAKIVMTKEKPYVDDDTVRYVINPVPLGSGGKFKVNVPQNLLGKSGATITHLCGCKGISFVHHTGFLIVADTKEAGLAFCKFLLGK